ncbi:MAG TPA: MHYT domain-containing protein [Micromonosporaceae bacterium]
MGQINHFTYGWITPTLSYALSVLGSLLGLTCATRVRDARTAGRRAWWLIMAAWAIGGTGIWVMHFMAMLGFGVSGAVIRYDVATTAASAVIAIVVVGIGLFIVGLGRPNLVKVLFGGLFAGLGVAAMHYTGMYAMRLDGQVDYDRRLVIASIVIAVVAATVALWLCITVRRTIAIIGSALVMGVAVNGMHFTAMFAMSVHLHDPTGEEVRGASASTLLIPIVLAVIFVVVGLIYAMLAAPTDEDRAGAAYLDARIYDRLHNGETVPLNGHTFGTPRGSGSYPRRGSYTPR